MAARVGRGHGGWSGMKPSKFDYHVPANLEDAIALRAKYQAESAVLAGGQSLMPALNFRLANPSVLIDIARIPELVYVDDRGSEIAVGAMTRQRDLELSNAATRFTLLGETLALVAHRVVRNRGTVGGSIAHGDMAAELPTLLVALEGRVVARSSSGIRSIPASQLYKFHLTTSLRPDELLVEVIFPVPPPRSGWSFQEVTRRHGDYALAGVCSLLTLGDDGRVASAAIACCGVSSTPIRATEAEAAITGVVPDQQTLAEAAELTRGVVTAPDDPQASTGYRRDLVATLARRTLWAALERVKAGEVSA